MESVYRFFRKYFLSTALILLLFFITNVGLILGVLTFANSNSSDPDIPVTSICNGIHLQNTGEIVADGSICNTLRQKKAWAMILLVFYLIYYFTPFLCFFIVKNENI